YVDVGAAHPIFESDTKALYDAGWRGINIEPNKIFFTELLAQRPRERNLCVALSDKVGAVSYFEVVGTGLSTCNQNLVRHLRKKGHQVFLHIVPTATLAQLLDAHPPVAIDFLKIDVEGFEERVLAGNNWAKYRPSVILVECTYPESPKRRPTRIRDYL